MLKLVLLSVAFTALAIGARCGDLGAPPAKRVTAAELAEHTGAVQTVVVTGTVVDMKPSRGGVTYVVRNGDGFETSVLVTTEAQPPEIRIGSRYEFQGQTIGPGAVSLSTPGSIRPKSADMLLKRYASLEVKDGFAMMYTSHGVAKIAAPGVDDGFHQMELLTNKDGKTWAQVN